MAGKFEGSGIGPFLLKFLAFPKDTRTLDFKLKEAARKLNLSLSHTQMCAHTHVKLNLIHTEIIFLTCRH